MGETLWVEGRVVGLVKENASESGSLRIQRFEMSSSQLESLSQTYHQACFKTLQPDLLLFSAGHRNKFGFQAPQTRQGIETENIDWLNTACEGAIQIRFDPKNWQVFNLMRTTKKRWFHHQCELAL